MRSRRDGGGQKFSFVHKKFIFTGEIFYFPGLPHDHPRLGEEGARISADRSRPRFQKGLAASGLLQQSQGGLEDFS